MLTGKDLMTQLLWLWTISRAKWYQPLPEENTIYVCLLPPNTTDKLQPMDLSVNNPAKDFLRGKFHEWYSDQIWQQIDPFVDIEKEQLQPIDLSLPALQELGVKWLVEIARYISDNPCFIVRGLHRSGISKVLDNIDSDTQTSEESSDEETTEDGDEEDTFKMRIHQKITNV